MELEQRLPIALGEFVEQPTPGSVRERMKQTVEVHARCLDYCALSCNSLVA
jgi:hypothetical protein